MDGPTGIVEAITTRKLDGALCKGTLGDVLGPIYAAEDIGEEGQLPFAQVIMLWSMLQFEEK